MTESDGPDGVPDGRGHRPLRVLVGSPAAGMLPDAGAPAPAGTLLLDLGPDHPSQAGLLELRLWTEDRSIASAQVVVGAMHRGAEKLFEVRDYRQILMLADRHDWHAPFSGELAVALACEELLGLAVPERAVWLRTLLAEHSRILSHLAFLSYLSRGRAVDADRRVMVELLREQTLRLTGSRIHPMATRVGGLAYDASPEWLEAERRLMDAARRLGAELVERAATGSLAERLRGVAVLPAAVAASHGVSGPAGRASGLAVDLRLAAPYLGYAELGAALLPPPDTSGDAAARLAVLAAEVTTSAELVERCCVRLAGVPGPVATRLPKTLRLPEGECYRAIEAPLGIAGVYLVSRGEKTPWRLKLRTPSFAQVSALESVLPGVRVEDLEAALASMGYVIGDVDR